MKIIKRVIVVFIVAFALFYLVSRPHEAANAVQGAVGMVWGAGEAVARFFTTLAGS